MRLRIGLAAFSAVLIAVLTGCTSQPCEAQSDQTQHTIATAPSDMDSPLLWAGPCKNPNGINNYTIADMKVGETCLTVGWAMREDLAGVFWLDPTYDVTPSAMGTLHMPITRLAGGFMVTINKSDEEEKYTKERVKGLLPVVKLTVNN